LRTQLAAALAGPTAQAAAGAAGHCRAAITVEVGAIAGVVSVAVDLDGKRVAVTGEASMTRPSTTLAMTHSPSAESARMAARAAPTYLRRVRRLARLEEADEITNRVVTMAGVAKRKLAVNFVTVAASIAGLRQVAGSLEVTHDLRRRSFGDPDDSGDVSKACIRVGGDAFEHVRVVGHEPPKMVAFSGT
jgi:hypothetical protein